MHTTTRKWCAVPRRPLTPTTTALHGRRARPHPCHSPRSAPRLPFLTSGGTFTGAGLHNSHVCAHARNKAFGKTTTVKMNEATKKGDRQVVACAHNSTQQTTADRTSHSAGSCAEGGCARTAVPLVISATIVAIRWHHWYKCYIRPRCISRLWATEPNQFPIRK
jgi:hypothetical protein